VCGRNTCDARAANDRIKCSVHKDLGLILSDRDAVS